MQTQTKQYYTPEEAGEILSLHKETIYRWLRSGKLPGTKVSHKCWRISLAQIEQMMQAAAHQQTERAA